MFKREPIFVSIMKKKYESPKFKLLNSSTDVIMSFGYENGTIILEYLNELGINPFA